MFDKQGKGDTLANILKSTANDAQGGQQQKLLAQQRQLVADQRQQQLDAQAAQQQKLALKRQQEQQQQQQQQMQQQRAQVQQQAQQQKLLQQRQQEQARQEQLRQQQVQSQQHVQRQREQQQAEQQAEAEAASALGSAAGAAARVLNPRAQQLHLALLNASVSNAPQLLDSQKSTKYQPRNAYATNPAFPTYDFALRVGIKHVYSRAPLNVCSVCLRYVRYRMIRDGTLHRAGLTHKSAQWMYVCL